MLVDLAASGRRSWAVVGPAGSGKTRMMQALGDVARSAGIPIRALGESQNATDGIAFVLNIGDQQSQNITRIGRP